MEWIVPNGAKIKYDENKNIVYMSIFKEYFSEEAAIKLIESIHNKIKPKFGILGDYREIYYITQKARKIMAEYHHEDVIVAAAVVGSALQVKFGNLFLKFSNPKFPTKIFFSIEEAEKWLLEEIGVNKQKNKQ